MIEREYYPLDMAQEIIGCSVDDLLYLGASGKIAVHAVTNGLFGRLSRIDKTTGSIKTKEIARLPDVSEIPLPTLLELANRQSWYIKTLLATGQVKYLCTSFDYGKEVLIFSAPFSQSEKDFDEEMRLMVRNGAVESIIEIKDFVLLHVELEKAKTIKSGEEKTDKINPAQNTDNNTPDTSQETPQQKHEGQETKPPKPADEGRPEDRINTLLQMVLGMAIDAYGYNPDAIKNKATGGNTGSIHAALSRIDGLSADPDTVRKYLAEAVRKYPQAKPRKP